MPAIINSDDGVVSGSSGLKTSGGNDGILAFQNNGTEQARITAAGLLQFNSGYGSVATAYGCRAWVNFNGTGTVAIRASGNVTSITDNGTGDYTVNFTTAMPDANYSVVGSSDGQAAVASLAIFVIQTNSGLATGSVRFTTKNTAESNIDKATICVSIFR